MRKNAALVKGFGAAAVVGALLMFGVGAEAQTKKASPCRGLDEKMCKAKTAECTWVVPKKGTQRPYCRLRPARKTKS